MRGAGAIGDDAIGADEIETRDGGVVDRRSFAGLARREMDGADGLGEAAKDLLNEDVELFFAEA